jgi:hypothetical protein
MTSPLRRPISATETAKRLGIARASVYRGFMLLIEVHAQCVRLHMLKPHVSKQWYNPALVLYVRLLGGMKRLSTDIDKR